MSKIIKQQLNILNREKEESFENETEYIDRRFISPLEKIKEKKVDEKDILEENLNRFRKKLNIKDKSKSASKKREIVEKTVQWTDDNNKKFKLTLKQKKARKLREKKKELKRINKLK